MYEKIFGGIINENQRGALFRLWRFVKIIGPGMIVVLPSIDQLIKVELNDKVPGWQGLNPEQLEANSMTNNGCDKGFCFSYWG